MIDSYIGLGSNLNDPLHQVLVAQHKLAGLPNTRLIANSSLYSSPPLGKADQPAYINGVSFLRTSLSARELLLGLQQIERQQGRKRSKLRWQSRTLDLDLLLHGSEIIQTETLTIPHYAMAQRNFVIFPLLELNPDVFIPGIGSAAEVAALLSREDLCAVAQGTTNVAVAEEMLPR